MDDLPLTTFRLSKEILDGVVSDHHLEDISQKNRPLALRDKFDSLCSTDWLEAKEFLDTVLPGGEAHSQKVKCSLLVDVFRMGTRCSHDVKECVLQSILLAVDKPYEFYELVNESLVSSFDKIDISRYKMLDAMINDLLIGNSDSTDLQDFAEMVKKKCIDEHLSDLKGVDLTSIQESPALNTHVVAACRLSWSMAVQHVPMTFSTEGIGQKLNGDTQKPYYTCDPSGQVDYYIHPAMFHGDKLLQQGTVYLTKS